MRTSQLETATRSAVSQHASGETPLCQSSPGIDRDSGAAMVELAFVLSLLVMLLVGTVSAGVAYGRNNSVENAAREASRYAATLPGPVNTTWLQDVRDVARAAAMGNLDASVDGQHICVAHYDGSDWTRLTDTNGGETTGTTACFSDNLPADQQRVQIVGRRDAKLNVVFFSMDVTLEGEASARYER